MGIDLKGQRFCDECGSLMTKAHRIEDAKEYCSTCYPRVFPPRPCTACDGIARAHRFVTEPVCSKCLRKGRKCLRCDREIVRAGIRVGSKFACAACAVHFRPTSACPGCGKQAPSLSRVGSEGEAVCNNCRNRATNMTCVRCRKFRLVSMTVGDKAYCASCIPGDEVSHPCPDCAQPVPGTGEAPCLRCYNRRKVQSCVSLACAGLERPWSRDLLSHYGQWLCAEYPTKPALHRLLEKHVPFFARIDAIFFEASQITSQALLAQLGSAYLRQYLLASRFLQASLNIPVDLAARQLVAERATIDKLMADAKLAGVEDLLQCYAAWLDQQSIALRTQRLYLSSAVAFAIYAQLQLTQAPGPDAISAFLKERPGLRANLMKFTRFARDVLGWEVRVGPAPASKKRPATVTRMQALLAGLPKGSPHLADTPTLANVLALALGYRQGALMPHPHLTRGADLRFFLHKDGENIQIPDVLQPIADALWSRDL